MRTLKRGEEGSAAVEFGIVLPLLLVLAAMVAPLIMFGYEYMEVQRAASHGVRYASRAETNALPGGGGRRPAPVEVRQFVSDSSGGKVAPASVTVAPDPTTALPGEVITVSIDHAFSYGAIADIANGVKQAFFGGGAFLPPQTVTVSARGREE